MMAIIATVIGVVLMAVIAMNAWNVRLLIEIRTWILGSPENPGLVARVRRLERIVFKEPQL